MLPKSAIKKVSSAAAVGKRKKLSFAESAAKAAAAAIRTTHVNAPVVTGVAAAKYPSSVAAARKKKQSAKPAVKTASSVAKKFAAADTKRRGIVKARKEAEKTAEPPLPSDEENSSDDEDEMLNGDGAADGGADDLSDVADRSSSDDGPLSGTHASSLGSRQGGSNGTVAPYRAVRLSFLPPEFEEPQLYKFLNQFGATVLNCFCVRSRRSHRSRGIAYVEFDKESVIPLVVEECNGMALGGMSVRARAVTMRRRMPSRQMVDRRRALAYAYKTKGTPLKKHDVRRKDPVTLLMKAVRTEKDNNNYLRSLGIDFETDIFRSQLAKLPAGLIKKRSKANKARRNAVAEVSVVRAAITTTNLPEPTPKACSTQGTRTKTEAKKSARPASKKSVRA